MVETGNPYRDNVSRLITWGHWFSFFNILLAMLIATRYLGSISWPSTTLGVTYLIISWIGHFSFLSFVTYLLTVFPLSFVLPRRSHCASSRPSSPPWRRCCCSSTPRCSSCSSST